MFKKILSVVVIVILFMLSGMIFWERFWPETFYRGIEKYPMIGQTVTNIGFIDNKVTSYVSPTSTKQITSSSGRIILDNNTWNVEIAKTDITRADGLSNRPALRLNQGMLFVFDKLDKHSFWMKDMFFALDIIFFDDKWEVVEIAKNASPNSYPNIFGDKIKSKFILEINAGEADIYKIKVGDKAVFVQN